MRVRVPQTRRLQPGEAAVPLLLPAASASAASASAVSAAAAARRLREDSWHGAQREHAAGILCQRSAPRWPRVAVAAQRSTAPHVQKAAARAVAQPIAVDGPDGLGGGSPHARSPPASSPAAVRSRHVRARHPGRLAVTSPVKSDHFAGALRGEGKPVAAEVVGLPELRLQLRVARARARHQRRVCRPIAHWQRRAERAARPAESLKRQVGRQPQHAKPGPLSPRVLGIGAQLAIVAHHANEPIRERGVQG